MQRSGYHRVLILGVATALASCLQMLRRGAFPKAFKLGLLVSFAILTTSACGAGGDGEGGEPEQQEEAQNKTLPEAGKPLSAGRYAATVFEPAVSFSVGDGWMTAGSETRDGIPLVEANGPTIIGFLNVEEVFDPSQPDETIPAPDDMLSWLNEHPRLDTEEPSRVSVGGVAGQQFDAISTETVDAKVCSEPCAPLFAFGDGNDFWLGESEKYRFIVLDDVGGETVTILFGGPAVEFEETLPKAQKVLDTVEWQGE
jgi:hypothetical protein